MTAPLKMPMEGKIATPGLYDLTDLQYHGDCCDGPSISSSGLKVIADDPSEYWRTSYLNPKREKPPEKPCWNIGKAAHWLLLEPEIARKRIVVYPPKALTKSGGTGTNACKEITARALAENKVAIKPKQFEEIVAMRNALVEHPTVNRALRKGRAEASLLFQDPESSVWLKAKPDYLPTESGLYIVDYKTTDAADISDWDRRSIIDHGLAMQAVLQMWAAKKVMEIEPLGVMYIVQSKKAPYRVSLRRLRLSNEEHRSILMRARLDLRHSIDAFAHGIATGEWPSPWNGVSDIEAPGWHQRQIEHDLETASFTYEDDYVC